MILEVQITDPMTGASRKMRFSHSPVRIGRNQLNDLSLDTPFVSEWHGTIRFDNNSVAYFDLGSTNGSMLDGKRLAKNVAVELTEASKLQVGGVELTVATQSAEGAFVKTLGWGRPDDAPPPPARPGDRSRPPSSPSSSSSSSSSVVVASPRPGAGARAGASPSPSLPGPADGQRNPLHAAVAAADAAAVAGGGAHGHAPSKPAFRAPPAGDEHAPAPVAGGVAARQRQLLEAFAESFVGLRKGYEQFGAEVGVRTISGTTALHRARTAAELLDYLLQPNLDPAAASRELIAIFADLGIHHLAMMEAITEGVRAVLQSLDPRVNELDAGSGGILSRGRKAQWKTYLDRFDQLVTDDDELHTAIFSDEFARAYASVTLGDDGGARRKKEDKG